MLQACRNLNQPEYILNQTDGIAESNYRRAQPDGNSIQ
jgi:hypothetical protein